MLDILLGTALLLVVLALFTLFSYKAPYGMKAMSALANAACATLLVEALQKAFIGDLIFAPRGINFFSELGGMNGSLGGVAVASLLGLSLGVSPVYSLLMGAACGGFGILPGFVAGYIMSFVIRYLEKKVIPGLDLIVIIIICAPLTRIIATLADPVVNGTLLQIGEVLKRAADASPVVMGFILGGLIAVVAVCPLSSMALTQLIGLTGVPMGIGALAVFGSTFNNYVIYERMKFGTKKDSLSMAIEPLTQADITAANPIPVYCTIFVGGALSGILAALMQIHVETPGMATAFAGIAVAFADNGPKALMVGVGCGVISAIAGFVGGHVFRNYPIKTADEIRGTNTMGDRARK